MASSIIFLASSGLWPNCVVSNQLDLGLEVFRHFAGSSSSGMRAYLAALPLRVAMIFSAFLSPIPFSWRRSLTDFSSIDRADLRTGLVSALMAAEGPYVLHRYEQLEELLVQLRPEADEHGLAVSPSG